MRFAITCMVVAFCVSAGFGEDTEWQASPDVTGDWFDPANWSAGVPTADSTAYIRNGFWADTLPAIITYGNAFARYLTLGQVAHFREPVMPGSESNGSLVQTGGTLTAIGQVNIGGPMGIDTPSSYTMIGGQLSAGLLAVGQNNGNGLFKHIGGIVNVTHLKVGMLPLSNLVYSSFDSPSLDSSLGTYELSGGLLSSSDSDVGTTGRGILIQTGGSHEVAQKLQIGGSVTQNFVYPIPSDTFIGNVPILVSSKSYLKENCGNVTGIPLVLLPIVPSEGTYELHGGSLKAKETNIDRTGTLRQTAGRNEAEFISISTGGRYEFSGGQLQINSGLDLAGDLDFQNGCVQINGNGLLNFSRGQMLNTENARISAGENSLTIFSADFNPAAELGSFQSAGMVHVAGNDLVIAPDQGFTGWGRIDDHVDTAGNITASPGGSIDLRKGLLVRGGEVNIGTGEINIHNDESGLHSGSISAGSLNVGGPQFSVLTPYPIISSSINDLNNSLGTFLNSPGTFLQTGGVCSISGGIHVGGTDMSINVIAYNFEPLETSLPTLVLLENPVVEPIVPSSAYEITDGELSAYSLHICGYNSKARFVQSGGTVNFEGYLRLDGGKQASYTIFGGALTAGNIYLNSGVFSILNPESQIEINRLRFTTNSTFVAVPGSTIHVKTQGYNTGFDLRSTNPSAMSGLGNLTLIFEGGDDYVAEFEVAGQDRGVGYAGFFENFALDTLQIGSDEGSAYLQLVDDYDNQPDWESLEVLYVKDLILEEGSTLDLNGLDIYCLNFMNEGTLLYNGGIIFDGMGEPGGLTRIWTDSFPPHVVLPEPATICIMSIGLMGLLRKGKKMLV